MFAFIFYIGACNLFVHAKVSSFVLEKFDVNDANDLILLTYKITIFANILLKNIFCLTKINNL